jgi:hypothetical protein
MREHPEQESVIFEQFTDQLHLTEIDCHVIQQHPHHALVNYLLVLVVVLAIVPQHLQCSVDKLDNL